MLDVSVKNCASKLLEAVNILRIEMVSEWLCLSPVVGVGTLQAVDVLEPLRFQCQLRKRVHLKARPP